MRYKITFFDEDDNIIEQRVCENRKVLGGVIGTFMGDAEAFIVCDEDDLNGETIMKYSKGGW